MNENQDTQSDTTPTEPQPVETPAPASFDEAVDAIADKIYADETPRDEGGRFVARNAEETPPEDLTPLETEDEITDQPPESETVETEDTPSIDMPNSWSADRSDMWAAVPPEAQKFVSEREAEAHKQITAMGEAIASFRPTAELLNTRMDTFARNGVTVEQGLTLLLDAQDALNRDPVGAIQEIARTVGVDLNQFGTVTGDQGETTPQVATLQKQVSTLQQQLQQNQNQLAQFQQQSQQTAEMQESQAREQVSQEIETWSKDKPYYEAGGKVARLMGSYLRPDANGQSLAQDLDEAYDMAINADPETRKKVDEERKAKEAEARNKAAAEAKRKASVNVGNKPGKASPKPKKGDIFDTDYLGNLYDKAQERLAG